jgi:hypothetical protein
MKSEKLTMKEMVFNLSFFMVDLSFNSGEESHE